MFLLRTLSQVDFTVYFYFLGCYFMEIVSNFYAVKHIIFFFVISPIALQLRNIISMLR